MLDKGSKLAKRARATGPGMVQHPTAQHLTQDILLQRAEELAALNATLLDISAPYELPGLLERILERAVHLLNAQKGSLFLADHARREARCVALYGFSEQAAGLVLPFGQGATGKVAESGQPLIIQDYPSWPGRIRELPELQEVKALLSVPMLWQGQVSGVINVAEISRGRVFTRAEIELLSMFAHQSAILMENARLLQAEHQQREAAETLREIASVLTACLDREQVLRLILEQLARVVQCDSASVMLITGRKLEIVAAKGFDLEQRKSLAIESLKHLQEVIENRRYQIIPDTQADPRWIELPQRSSIRCWLGVPLVFQERVIGVLNLDKDQPGFYSAAEAELTAAYANQAAIAIENARLYEAESRRAQLIETLRQATAAVSSTLSQDETIERILEQLAYVAPYDSASVQLLHKGYLEIVGGRGWPDPSAILGTRFPIPGDNPNTQVILERKPLIVHDTTACYTTFSESGYGRIRSWMGVPLIVQERVIGMVSIDSYTEHYFTPEHMRFASAFADQVAIAIENARLYTLERQRVNELDALRATIADITSELELPNLLRDILERAVTLMHATGGDLGIFNEADRNLLVVTSFSLDRDYTGTCMELGEGLMGQVALTLEPLIVADYQNWPGKSSQYDQGPWSSAIVVPLLMGSKLLGAIGVVDSEPERQFTASDQRLLTMFAQQASIAINNARMYLATKEAADRRAILQQASQAIVAASLDPEGIYAAIHLAASQLMPSEAFVISLMNEAENVIEAVYLVDRAGRTPPITLPAGAGLSGHIIRTGKPLYIEDLEEDEQVASVRFGDQQDVRSILAAPMILRDKVIGMLSVQSYQARAYTAEDLNLLEMLSAHAAIAIDNTRLFKEVQLLAITDPLTGANNRRQLFDLGEREFVRAQRYKHLLSAMMIDIDDFKKVNDSYGHTTGDQVLVQLTGRIRANIRDIDILGRFGGDEFVILLPETGPAAARQVAERLRQAISGSPFETQAGAIRMTVSIGVSTLGTDMPSLETLISRADMAVYMAKDGGLDQVRQA